MKKKIVIPLIIIFSLAGLFLLGRFGLKLGSRQYDSFEEFKDNAYLRFTVDIPEGAEDQRFYSQNTGIGKRSLYAFTLSSDDYGKLIRAMVEQYDLECDPEDNNAKYGYASYYMKKVKDLQDPDYSLDNFPLNLAYDKVIDDDIRDYYVIVYSPMSTGTNSSGLVANPDTGRILVFNMGNIR